VIEKKETNRLLKHQYLGKFFADAFESVDKNVASGSTTDNAEEPIEIELV